MSRVGACAGAAILLLFSRSSAVSGQSSETHPAQIILIRHAEQPHDSDDPHLSKGGVQRAERLVSYFSDTRFGPPVALFATRTTKDGSGQRTQETVAPLAQQLQLPVETPFLSKHYADLARLILRTRDYAGKTVLVCWIHSTLPQLAGALGVSPRPPKWKDKVFDRGYLISYQHGKAILDTIQLP